MARCFLNDGSVEFVSHRSNQKGTRSLLSEIENPKANDLMKEEGDRRVFSMSVCDLNTE